MFEQGEVCVYILRWLIVGMSYISMEWNSVLYQWAFFLYSSEIVRYILLFDEMRDIYGLNYFITKFASLWILHGEPKKKKVN